MAKRKAAGEGNNTPAPRTTVRAPRKAGALAPSRRRDMEPPVKVAKVKPARKGDRISRVKKSPSEIEIIDRNPKNCPYRNPRNMSYVEAVETRDGEIIREGLMLLNNDHIARLENGK